MGSSILLTLGIPNSEGQGRPSYDPAPYVLVLPKDESVEEFSGEEMICLVLQK